jgi:hypothetical protein
MSRESQRHADKLPPKEVSQRADAILKHMAARPPTPQAKNPPALAKKRKTKPRQKPSGGASAASGRA